ncbi:MAG: cyclopropane-fatty-acyl-phospholipid synthase family protein [Sphingobium sp.]|uniref:cyclopropane-fatty-acyl-phospholipid synthase family protein n=1 Tax=Sphingobium sp. TaxID=1912891 RepID=UPI0029A36C69|nr:cyclopropane-fatty-acyl-phospholipid synthase family protein [Sphingobium sp.]MDX3908788.1 cyclopropane-fatty-acyl-phospholipid synthase family protein [Sphingobium sp.]
MNAQPPRRGRHLVTAGGAILPGRNPFARLIAWRFHGVVDRIDAGLVTGSLEAHLPDGTTRVLGARAAGPSCIVYLRDWRALVRLGLGGSVGWYRAWTLGEWDSPDPVPLFALFMANARTLGGTARARGVNRWLGKTIQFLRKNSLSGARRNIAFHYDLGNDFYRLWLDDNLHYSSALFSDPSETLEVAQQRKAEAVIKRLALKDGDRLLEIGCGWGGLAQVALEHASINYEGLTLSVEQQAFAAERLARAGFAERARVELTDYRDVAGTYDAIASVEMVEAVGQQYWPDYLAAIHRMLKPGGRAALQYICIDDAIFDRYADSIDFIQAYIFPGGLLLSESRFRAIAEAQGLIWQDQHNFGQHYAETLKQWRERFDAAVEAGRLPASFDAEFVRLWRYYLMYCEGGFRGGGIDVAQVTLTRAD